MEETPDEWLEDRVEAQDKNKFRAGGIVLVGLGIIIIAVFGFGWSPLSPEPRVEDLPVAAAVGSRAPDFRLRDLQGTEVSLSDLKGTNVLINFWATWCTPCRIEMPYIQNRFERYRGEFAVLAIDFDEPVERVRTFAAEFGLTFDILLDPGATVQDMYEVRGYPTSYFVDSDGVIRAVHIGIMSEDQLDGYLSQLGLR